MTVHSVVARDGGDASGLIGLCDVSESKMVMSGEKRADGRENLIDAHPIESRLDRHFYFFTGRLDPHPKLSRASSMVAPA